jgi:hypothetical protein
MSLHIRPADLTLSRHLVAPIARRERFLRRVATVVPALAASVAVLVVSINSMALGMTWGEP